MVSKMMNFSCSSNVSCDLLIRNPLIHNPSSTTTPEFMVTLLFVNFSFLQVNLEFIHIYIMVLVQDRFCSSKKLSLEKKEQVLSGFK